MPPTSSDQPILASSQAPARPAQAPSDAGSFLTGATQGATGQRMPWIGVQGIVVALVVWAVGAVYTLEANPEIVFFKYAARLKQSWAARMTQHYGPKTVFCGGSSCTFSIDPQRLLDEHHLPAANLGLGAGMGLRVLTRFALDQVRPGDTLILAMEPPVLTSSTEETMLGVQISFALGHPAWLSPSTIVDSSDGVPWVSSALMLRPGGYHTFTLLGKLLSRKPLYRYQISEFRSGGWQQSPLRLDLPPWVGEPGPLPDDTRQFLTSLRDWCQAHQVRLAYSLPWTYTDAAHAPELRRNNLRILREIASILPVLKDPLLGVDTAKEHFADTVWHLTESAARQRTDELARQMKSWELWSVEELKAADPGGAARPGQSAPGT